MKRIGRTTIYQDPWVNLYVDKVEMPNGRIIERHHVVDFERPAVGALVRSDGDELLLVEAYRYVLGTTNWEIPCGGVEKGETIIEAACRETLEETGYSTMDHTVLYTYYPMCGIANKVFHIVTCRAGTCTGPFDPGEIKSTKWFTRDEIRQMVNDNGIRDGLSLTALLLYLRP